MGKTKHFYEVNQFFLGSGETKTRPLSFMELIWWVISLFSEFRGKRLESAQVMVDQVTYRVCE